MIDFTRIKTDRNSVLSHIKNTNVIDLFHSKRITDTDFISENRKGKYYNFDVKITKNFSYLGGSFHQLFNMYAEDEKHNYNDFSYCDFQETLDQFCNDLSVNKFNAKPTFLEFGLNIETSINPQDLIDYFVLMYDYKAPNRDTKFDGDYLEFERTDYNIKIYNKSKPFKIRDKYILRVELKIKRSRYLEKHFEIFNLSDIDRLRFKMLFKDLLNKFNDLLIVDSLFLVNPDCSTDFEVFKNGINPNHWKGYFKTKTYKRKDRFKKKFENILLEYNMVKTKAEIKNSLMNKFAQLMNCNVQDLQINNYKAVA